MNAKPNFNRHSNATSAAAAFLSALIAIGIIGAVTGLFQSRGIPMGELATAERACSTQVYVSDREHCMREWIAARHGNQVAKR
jgi:hypothetical protein